MTLETEQARRSREREHSRESKETTEDEFSKELEAASAMEKADHIVREAKSAQQHMKNIVINMQQVTAAIRALRQTLALAADDNDTVSMQQDKARVEVLKKKIAGLEEQLIRMKDDLIREQITALQSASPETPPQVIEKQAREMVGAMIASVKG